MVPIPVIGAVPTPLTGGPFHGLKSLNCDLSKPIPREHSESSPRVNESVSNLAEIRPLRAPAVAVNASN